MLIEEASNAPPQRGIHRRAASARERVNASAPADRIQAWRVTCVVFVLAVALGTPQVSAWAVAVALGLLAHWAWPMAPRLGDAGALLIALGFGQWALAGGLPGACIAALLWLPALNTRPVLKVAWAGLLAAPLLWLSVPGNPTLFFALSFGLTSLWLLSARLFKFQTQAALHAYDREESDAVVLKLQSALLKRASPAGDHSLQTWPAAAMDTVSDAALLLDADGYVKHSNAAARSLLGKSAAALAGTPVFAHIACLDADTRTLAPSPLHVHLKQHARLDPGSRDCLFQLQPSGIEFSAEWQITEIAADGGASMMLLTLADLSAQRDAEHMAHYYSTHDEATGLPRLRQLQTDLRAAGGETEGRALMLIDLDRFDAIIDNLGFEAGSVLTREAVERIKQHLRADDRLYRISLDLLGVLCGPMSADELEGFGHDLCRQVASVRAQIQGKSHRLTSSVGIVRLESAADPDVYLARASVARTLAKRAGGNRARVYHGDDPMAQAFGSLADWSSRLYQAIEDDRLLLYLHPLQALQPGLPPRAELLLRLPDDSGFVLAPEHFLPAAERQHLMPQIDLWVVNTVFSRLAAGDPALDNYACHGLNLSGQSLSDAAFRAQILAAAEAHARFAPRLCFEVTESVVLADVPGTAAFLAELKKLGFGVALDDFGSGYSSYGYMRELPVDTVKIDGSFIIDVGRDPTDQAMVDSITRLAHRLEMLTVAEHVRDPETLEILRRLGVDYAQGDAVGKPRLLG